VPVAEESEEAEPPRTRVHESAGAVQQ
jgi:hypothetical protein